MIDLLKEAARVAVPSDINFDNRTFWIGAIGFTKDGRKVSAKNGYVVSGTFDNYQKIPNSHAEGRLIEKIGKGGDAIFVSRITKSTKEFAMARPCSMCRIKIKSAKINKVYYSINNEYYGIWYPDKDYDKIVKI